MSAVCVLGLAAVAAPVLSTAAASPAAAASAAAGSTSLPTPGLYHQPIIGKVVLPGLGQVLGHGLRHATNVQSQNWSGYADNQDTYDSVAASWIQPAVNCSAGGGGGGGVLNGLLGGNGLGNLLGPGSSAHRSGWPRRLQLHQRRAARRRLGLQRPDADVLRLVGNVPQSLSGPVEFVSGPSRRPDDRLGRVQRLGHGLLLGPEGQHRRLVLRHQPDSVPRVRALLGRVVAEAPSSCNILFCSEVPLADFGQVGFGSADLIDSSGNNGSLAAFNANAITMANGNRRLPSRATSVPTAGRSPSPGRTMSGRLRIPVGLSMFTFFPN